MMNHFTRHRSLSTSSIADLKRNGSKLKTAVCQVQDEESNSILRQLQLKCEDENGISNSWTETLASCLELLDQYNAKYQLDPSHIHSRAEEDILKKIQQRLRIGLTLEIDSDGPKLESQGRRELILRMCCIQMENVITFILNLLVIVPEWLKFWQQQQRRWYLITKLESGPFLWLVPRSKRIQTKERLRALQETLESHVSKLGRLKQQLMRLQHQEESEKNLERLLNQSFTLMESILDPKSVYHMGPRVGWDLPETKTGAATKTDSSSLSISCQDNDPIAPSLEILVAKLIRISDAQQEYKIAFDLALRGCEQPSPLRRKWFPVSIATFCVLGGCVYFYRHRQELIELRTHVIRAVKDFFMEHMFDPLRAIVEEVILNKKPEIQDPAALLDTKESLRRMLDQFLADTQPLMPLIDRQTTVQNMDMSVVSVQFEKEIPKAMRNILSGDIVRMLLIQVQFIKKELMVAMGSIDDLVNANQLNMQMLATIPTFIVLGGAYKILEKISSVIVSVTSQTWSNPSIVFHDLRESLRDIERLLNRRNHPEESKVYLNERDMGYLLLLLHRLHCLFQDHHRLFDASQQLVIQQDLSDLVDPNMAVPQQLATINRMYHTHAFLKVTVPQSQWFF